MIAYLIGGPCDLTKVAIPDNRDYFVVPIFEQVSQSWVNYGHTDHNAPTLKTAGYRRAQQVRSQRDTYIFEYVGVG